MHPSTYRQTSTSYPDRIRGILSLNPATFRDVEEDMDATGQAALTVLLAALASGVGALFSRDVLTNALGIGVSSILQWIVFSVVAYIVGSTIFKTERTSVTVGQVLRTVGFAQAPKFLMIVAFVPLFGWIVALVALIWFIVAAIYALREAFEFDTARAIGTGAVALIGIAILDLGLSVFFGIGSALFGALDSVVRSIIPF
ncbi:MAG: YIP1 family protein [Thermomicrobiales bacterium]